MAQTYVTAIRLSQGKTVRHITKVWCSSNPVYSMSDEGVELPEMIRRLSTGAVDAYVQSPKTKQTAKVEVVPRDNPRYLRTRADDSPDDNLLHLPEK